MNAAGDQSIANATWRRGYLHLTVDADGMVSLWDWPFDSGDTCCPAGEPPVSYLRLPITPEQRALIEATMAKGGFTP